MDDLNSTRYDEADSELFAKILEARRDMNHSLFIIFDPRFELEIRDEQRKHVDVMKDYINELQKARDELRQDYMAEFDKKYSKPPF